MKKIVLGLAMVVVAGNIAACAGKAPGKGKAPAAAPMAAPIAVRG